MTFQDGAVVCFVGDSITHTGTYIKHILHTYRTKFPSSNVEFYDCGIAGGTLANTIAVYDEDIGIYNPTKSNIYLRCVSCGVGPYGNIGYNFR